MNAPIQTPAFWLQIADQPLFCLFEVKPDHDPLVKKMVKIPYGLDGKKGIPFADHHRLATAMDVDAKLMTKSDNWRMGLGMIKPIEIDGKLLVCVDIDFDDKVDAAGLERIELIKKALFSAGAYHEKSVSGFGSHFFVLCDRDQIPQTYDSNAGWKIEVFSGVENQGKLICLTDQDVSGALVEINLGLLFKQQGLNSTPNLLLDTSALPSATQVTAPVLANIELTSLNLKQKTLDTIINGGPVGTRSTLVYQCIKDLIKAGCSDDEMASLMTNPMYQISAKALEKGSLVVAQNWILGQIPKLRAQVSLDKRNDLAPNHMVDPATGEIIQSFGSSPIASFLFNPELIEHLPVQKGTGKYVPDLQNLYFAISQMKIGFDEFHNQLLYSNSNTGQWTKFTDANYVHVGVALQHLNFSNPSMELIRQLVKAVGRNNTFDSAIDWANSLKWDGVERCKDLLHIYFGVEQTPLSDAASLYMATAMAARALKSDAIVDMVPVLIGDQGVMKSTSVKALAPMPEQFVEIDLSSKDDDISRALRGILVVELGELKGLKTRAAESIKSWIARQVDEWIPKYQEYADSYKRRCFMVATTNEDDFLTDTTGNRRWIALNVESSCKPDLIIKDRDQIWAEAVAMFKANGVFYKEVQTLAEPVNRLYLATNEVLEHEIQNWLFSKCNPPAIRVLDIMNDLYMEKNKDMGLMKSVARALTSFGYSKKRAAKGKGNVWFKECN